MYIYHSFYQRVDEEEFGGLWELVKEGMMTSFALFLVSCCVLGLRQNNILFASFFLIDCVDYVLHLDAVRLIQLMICSFAFF